MQWVLAQARAVVPLQLLLARAGFGVPLRHAELPRALAQLHSEQAAGG